MALSTASRENPIVTRDFLMSITITAVCKRSWQRMCQAGGQRFRDVHRQGPSDDVFFAVARISPRRQSETYSLAGRTARLGEPAVRQLEQQTAIRRLPARRCFGRRSNNRIAETKTKSSSRPSRATEIHLAKKFRHLLGASDSAATETMGDHEGDVERAYQFSRHDRGGVNHGRRSR